MVPPIVRVHAINFIHRDRLYYYFKSKFYNKINHVFKHKASMFRRKYQFESMEAKEYLTKVLPFTTKIFCKK